MKKWIPFILLILTTLGGSCTHSFEGVEDNTPVGNFETLWRTIDQKYCFVEEKNVDWQMVHDTILPKVQRLSKSDNIQLFDVLDTMLNTLQDGHVNLYSAFDVSQCKEWYEGYPTNFDKDILDTYYLNNCRHAGAAYYQTIANGEIGYIYCNSFENAVSAANMSYILRSFKNCKGVVVDVRNNGGGSMEYAKLLASTFFSQTRTVGYWQHKSGTGHEDFSKLEAMEVAADMMPSKCLLPTIVLCNRRTYSAANFFVSAMRYADNSLILGGTSGGGGGMPLSYELPNGWIVRFSSIRMVDKDKHSIEPGIQPDVWVEQKSTDQDDLIEKAVSIILSLYK